MAGRTSLTVYEGMIGMTRERLHQHQEPIAHDHRRRARFPKAGANGVILAQAGRFGGWSLYLKDGKPTYTYNFLGLQRLQGRRHRSRCPPGKATIRFEFAYDGGGLGKGGTGTIFVNGKKVAKGRIERTQCCVFSADEGADVGVDDGTPVTDDYKEP